MLYRVSEICTQFLIKITYMYQSKYKGLKYRAILLSKLFLEVIFVEQHLF